MYRYVIIFKIDMIHTESCNFWKPNEWSRWWKCFEDFRITSGLAAEAEEYLVNTLLYCFGNDADDVLHSITMSEEDQKKYVKVLDNFDQFFQVWKNIRK